MSRNMLILIAASDHWDFRIQLTNEAILELNFWKNNCRPLPRKSLFPVSFLPDRIVFTDASGFASAGFAVQTSNKIVHKMWTPDEAKKSSTFRELSAVFITLFSLLPDFQNRLVKIYTDNQNVVKIVQAGSMRSELQEIALKIFNLCILNCISLQVEWVPRELNTTADFYSKLFDFNDWYVNDVYFKYFNSLWGPFDCDVFADYNNHKLTIFFSAYWCPDTSGVDAFGFSWNTYNCWLVPPVHLVGRALNHMLICKGKGTIVVPKWTSSCFWPILWSSSNNQYKSFVKDFVEYVKPSGFFCQGSDKNSIFIHSPLTFNVLFRFKHSHWESLKQFSNPDLKALTVSLCSVVTASKSENTLKKYKGYFKRFKYWCLKYNLPFLPTTVCTVAIYLNYLIQSGVSTAVLNAAYYSIKWEHDLNLYDSILNDKLLEMVLEGGIRLLSKPLKRKEPITPTILKSIIAKFDKNDNLPGLRICAMMLLGFSGFLRYDELAHIRSSDLTFNDSHLQINIQKSKTDRYRQGNTFNF
ncbi:unnamed protein product [Mytilus coruscus]|uniref:RNase H type-1 domain-containing protein n=1 Tax=Mytilus coruscus TaxID=42192 RepID=A0A6J8DSK6_MYTCO|nr:unnamed protein product [Mytilus coruscus]